MYAKKIEEENIKLRAEKEILMSALKEQIMIYQVSDEAWDKEADANRIMVRILTEKKHNVMDNKQNGPTCNLNRPWE